MSDIVLSTEEAQTGGQSEGKTEDLGTAVSRANTDRIFRAGDEMSVFFEVYNLILNETTGLNKLKAEYVFIQAGKTMARIPAPPIEPSAQKDCRLRTSFRLKNFQPGEYILRAAVTDENSGQAVSREISFSVSVPKPPK